MPASATLARNKPAPAKAKSATSSGTSDRGGAVMAQVPIAEQLQELGIYNTGEVYANLNTPALYEKVVQRREGVVGHLGPIVVRTGHHTGRSPNDRFIVEEPSSKDEIWWGAVNRPFAPDAFEMVLRRQLAYLQDKDIFIQDCYVGAHPKYRVAVRVITETAWHSLFVRNMFIRELDPDKLKTYQPQFTILHTPRFQAVPEIDGTASEAFILMNLGRKMVLIGGTQYAGETKKSAFAIMNYLLPQQQVLGMHCSANYGKDHDDVALFFGLSGTGKTTLSTSSDRTLIGDDEHGWSDEGIFNFEGGCYAKTLGVTADSEPEIYETTRMFGTVLENVTVDPVTRHVDLSDNSLSENTRAAYPLSHIRRADRDGVAGHPKHVIFLTYDAFGVLPPVAQLTPEQASYHFLCGFTSKVAGTEAGITEPTATFSPCFGAPFMPLPPGVYANLLSQKIVAHGADCWLVNTGLTGGSYGTGSRMSLKHTRAIVSALLSGKLADVAMTPDSRFNLSVPSECPGVPTEILDPRSTWSDPAAYDQKADDLAARFKENYAKHSKI